MSFVSSVANLWVEFSMKLHFLHEVTAADKMLLQKFFWVVFGTGRSKTEPK